jgi:hypothetical protein
MTALIATALSMRLASGKGLIHNQTTSTERGDIVAYHGVGKLDWGFGPAGAEFVIIGSDVLVMKGDKIGALYTFVNPPKK